MSSQEKQTTGHSEYEEDAARRHYIQDHNYQALSPYSLSKPLETEGELGTHGRSDFVVRQQYIQDGSYQAISSRETEGELATVSHPDFGPTGLQGAVVYRGEGTNNFDHVQVNNTTMDYQVYLKKDNKQYFCTFPGCDQGGSSFNRSYNAKRHIQSRHTLELVATCEICCGRPFSRKDNKKTHEHRKSTTTSRRRKRRQVA